MSMKLYPPKGGEPVLAHDTQVENMKRKGWVESNPTITTNGKKAKQKVKEDGQS